MLYPIPIRPGVEQQRASLLSLLAAVLMVTASLLPPSLPPYVASDYVRRGSFENLHNVLSVAQQWQSSRRGREGNRTGK